MSDVQRIEPSGLYHTNIIARFTLEAIEQIVGKRGLNAILNLAELSHLIDNYPPANLEKAFDFADYSTLMGALDETYGRGGRGLQMHAGRAAFNRGRETMEALAGVEELPFGVLPLNALLPAVARACTRFSDQSSWVEDDGDRYLYHTDPCPVCWGRTADRPICFSAKGMLQEALHCLTGRRSFRVDEVECVAMGGESCTFAIQKEPVG